MKFQVMTIIAALMLTQMCTVTRSVPVEQILAEDNMSNSDEIPSDQKAAKTGSYLEQMNLCIDICYECFKEDLTASDSNVIVLVIFLFVDNLF